MSTEQNSEDLALIGYRCFVFKSTIEQAWHNNLFRAYCRPLLGAKQPDGKVSVPKPA